MIAISDPLVLSQLVSLCAVFVSVIGGLVTSWYSRRLAVQTQVAQQVTDAKLNTIHTLVNSEKTASYQRELDTTIRELALLRIHASCTGDTPSARAVAVETKLAIAEALRKITQLNIILADRAKQTETAAKEADVLLVVSKPTVTIDKAADVTIVKR